MSAPMDTLRPVDVDAAVQLLSMDGHWHYTARNLYYALVRSGALPEPTGDAADDLQFFKDQLAAYEGNSGLLEKLIRPEFLEGTFASDPLSDDLGTYAVKRVMIFERSELMMLFARNHFFMKLECILLGGDGSPNHVQARVESQLEAGMPMDFFVVHDATLAGYRFHDHVVETHGHRPGVTIQQTAITFDQANQNLKVRRSGTLAGDLKLLHSHPEEVAHLAGGHYIHLEEVVPLTLMRMVYNRTVGRFDEVGFG